MLTKLKWTARFKIAILITNSPCHGLKYHGPMRENHPNEDIEETILQLID
jgi:myosin protein heavy chain